MADMSVYNLAKLVGMTPEKLLEQLKAAKVSVEGLSAKISDVQKKQLMQHLSKRRAQGSALLGKTDKLSLSRSSANKPLGVDVKQNNAGSTSVRVEVLRKRRPQREIVEETIATAPVVEEESAPVSPISSTVEQSDKKETKNVAVDIAPSSTTSSKETEKGHEEASEQVVVRAEQIESTERSQVSTEAQKTEEAPREEQTTESVAVSRKAKPESEPNKPKPESVKPFSEHGHHKPKVGSDTVRDSSGPKRGRGGVQSRRAQGGKQFSMRGGKLGGRFSSKSDQRSSANTQHQFEKPTARVVHEVILPDTLTVSELAQKMSVKAAAVIKVMMQMGAMVTINQVIDKETAVLVVEEMGHKAKFSASASEKEAASFEINELLAEPAPRAPVVTIMGHVDHGKTSLLDFIRRTRVTSGEAGGITQHIGAYHVSTSKGSITFLDTPGHAAFTAMRARGAQCTDIVVLVVAADDGVMPQTIEAIQHAKAAKVPIIVAVNKMDKEQVDPDRVKSELSQYDVVSEDWGGDILFQNISAKTGEGIEALLEGISLQAELLELKAIPNGPARGLVVESSLDRGRGPVATILVTQGQLHRGDVVLAGKEMGRVRAMVADHGGSCSQVGPSTPVEILGLSGVPAAGDEVCVLRDEAKAREVAASRQDAYREKRLAQRQAARLEAFFDHIGEGSEKQVKVLNLVLKTDVQGSLGAIGDALQKLSGDEVKVNILLSAVGGISESDVILAQASNAIIIGFNVRAEQSAAQLITKENIELRYYSVIYELIEEVKQALSGMLSPEIQEKILGLAEVREVFRSSKYGVVSGCMVIKGTVKRNLPIRVLRDNVVIYEGGLESLRHFKEDIQEVRAGMECGIGVKRYDDVKIRDQIECYEKVSVKRELS